MNRPPASYFRRFVSGLWESPTFTLWLNLGVQSLRLIAVTPLILTRLSSAEIAAWYLFATLTFFGQVLVDRIGVTFWRMIALAMGGASDLSPVRPGQQARGDGKPNWAAVERAYGTLAVLQVALGVFCGLLILGLGLFSLPNIVRQAGDSHLIWLSFITFTATSTLYFTCRRYDVFLYGTNHVALDARWSAVFSLLSTTAGCITMLVLPNILAISIVMQVILLLGVLRSRYFAFTVEGGRARSFRVFHFDRQVFAWAWEPFWRGIIMQFSDTGTIQLGAILFARYGRLGEVSAYLFTLRIVQTLTQAASTPFFSISPLFTKMISMGDVDRLRKSVVRRATVSLLLLGAGFAVLCVLGNFLLRMIGAHTDLLTVPVLVMIWLLAVHQWQMNFAWNVAIAGNLIAFTIESATSLALSLLLIAISCAHYGVVAVVAASWVPRLVLMNRKPFTLGARLLNCSPSGLFGKTYIAVLVSWAMAAAVLMLR